MPTDPKQTLYNELKSSLEMPPYEEFVKSLDGPKARSAAYKFISSKYPTSEADFYKSIGYGETKPVAPIPVAPSAMDKVAGTVNQVLGPAVEPLRQSVLIVKQGAEELGSESVRGIADILSGSMGVLTSPFSAADALVRQIPVVGEPLANAVALPFQAVAEGVKGGQRLIDKGLAALGVDTTPSKTSEAISNLNQGLAQIALGVGAAKYGPSMKSIDEQGRQAMESQVFDPKLRKKTYSTEAEDPRVIRGLLPEHVGFVAGESGIKSVESPWTIDQKIAEIQRRIDESKGKIAQPGVARSESPLTPRQLDERLAPIRRKPGEIEDAVFELVHPKGLPEADRPKLLPGDEARSRGTLERPALSAPEPTPQEVLQQSSVEGVKYTGETSGNHFYHDDQTGDTYTFKGVPKPEDLQAKVESKRQEFAQKGGAQPTKPTEVPDASTVRSNQEERTQAGQVQEGGGTDRGRDIQQEPSRPSDAPRAQEETQVEPKTTTVKEIPLSEVDVQPERFQPRVEGIDQELQAGRLKEFDRQLTELNPIKVWKDPVDGRYKVLAGHHRHDLFTRVGEKTIPAIEFIGDEKSAIDYAHNEQAQAKAQTPVDRANYYRKLREDGKTAKEIEDQASRLEGRNANMAVALSHLNPNGKALDAMKRMGTDVSENSRTAASIAQWIGEVRRGHKELTNSHENEMFDYLKNNFKTQGRKFSSLSQFKDFVNGVIDKRTNFGVFDETKPLNFENLIPRSRTEIEYDQRIAEAESAAVKAEKDLKTKRSDLLKKNATQTDIDRVLKPFDDAVTIAQRELLDLRKNRDKAIGEIRASEMSLFDEIDNTKEELRNANVPESDIREADRPNAESPAASKPPRPPEGTSGEGPILQSGLNPGVDIFYRDDLKPAVKSFSDGFTKTINGFKAVVSPASLSEDAAGMASIVRIENAKRSLEAERARASMEQAWSLFDRATKDQNLDFIHQVETGAPLPGIAGKFATTMREAWDKRWEDLNKLGVIDAYRTNYFSHLFKDPAKAREVLQQYNAEQKRLSGSKGFTKARTFDTVQDAINYAKSKGIDLELVSDNPVDVFLASIHNMDKVKMAYEIVKQSKEQDLAKFVKVGEQPPPGYERVNDPVFKAMQWSESEQGLVWRGDYYLPGPAAKVLNNYLSPGLHGKIGFDLIRRAGNLMNQVQLGLSGFHAGFTTNEAVASSFALGIKQLSQGKIAEGLTTIGKSPGRFATNVWEGNKFGKNYLKMDPETSEQLRAYIEAGARFKMDAFWRTEGIQNFRRSISSVKQAIDSGNLLGVVTRGAGSALKGAVAAIDAVNKPVMEWLVPRQKWGAFWNIASDIIADYKAGKISGAERTVRLQKAWDSIDNRFGQMVYDNLFWDRTLKDALMLSTRSVGWNYGTIRELAGGVWDITKLPGQIKRGEYTGISDRTSYVVALPLLVAMEGAVATYLMTGKGPGELKDLFFPPTGKTNPDGTAERLSMPSYMKDVAAYTVQPSTTVAHKLHPIWGAMYQMFDNRNYYGANISDADPMTMQWLGDYVDYAKTQFMPFSFTGFSRMRAAGESVPKSAMTFVGITPAPRYLTETKSQKILDDIMRNKMPQRTTKESSEERKFRSDFVKRIKENKPIAQDEYEKAQALGLIDEYLEPTNKLERYLTTDPMEGNIGRLTEKEFEKVYNAMTPQEREKYAGAIQKKVESIQKKDENYIPAQ